MGNKKLFFKKPELSYEEYERAFGGPNMPFLVSDIITDYYKDIGFVALSKNNEWTCFIPKKIKEKLLNEGLKIYTSRKRFLAYKKEYLDFIKTFKKKFLELKNKKDITQKDLSDFFEIVTQAEKYYSYTQYFYLDKVWKIKNKSSAVRKNLKEFGGLKIKGRELLNDMYFTEADYLGAILKKLSKKFGVEFKKLYQYQKNEIFLLFRNKKQREGEFKKRLANYIFFPNGERKIIYFGREADLVIDDFLKESSDEKKVLKGMVANKGIAKGKVKLFWHGYNFQSIKKKMAEMKKGEILVAETTSPEIMPACSKAGAIITNQGGMMSHAAIVARELKIPCIVGTKIATQVLKDGDRVEVNADKGVVKILKRA